MLSYAHICGDIEWEWKPTAFTQCIDFLTCFGIKWKKKSYKFVDGNLGLMSLCYSRRVFVKIQIPPFINLTTTETVENLCNHFERVRNVIYQSIISI